MKAPVSSRRELLKRAGVAAAVAIAGGGSRAAAQQVRPMRLGGPIYVTSEDPAVVAKAHRDIGYRAAYAPRNLSVNDKEKIAAWVKEMARQDVVIAEVGAFRNTLDPDPEKRRANVTWVTERLALAELLGARNCVDIAGSFHPTVWFGQHPQNFSKEFFDATVETSRRIIDAVKPQRTKFTIEMMPWSWPSGPDEYLQLIKAIDRQGFGVHMDVCNMMNSPTRFYNNGAMIEECFAKLGKWIASCHAKDLNWGPGVQVNIQEVIPGTGLIDYKTYLRELSKLPVDAPLMLEHLRNEADYTQGRAYIQGVAKSIGLSFG